MSYIRKIVVGRVQRFKNTSGKFQSLRHRGLSSFVNNPQKGTTLLIIDPQLDFHDSYSFHGTLAVPNAEGDASRVSKLIRDGIDKIDNIIVTLDSHHKGHIAHAAFWTNSKGERPAVFSEITCAQVKDRTWVPRNPAHYGHCVNYTEKLEESGRFVLMIWPEHCLIGSPGHAIHPEIFAAVLAWSDKKNKDVEFVLKGQNCFTEMYSAIKAEVVMKDDMGGTGENTKLLGELLGADRLLICGQALSHCVNFTVTDIVHALEKRDGMGSDFSKIFVLTDGA
jgi:nicotinamidase/pyrazinamidase